MMAHDLTWARDCAYIALWLLGLGVGLSAGALLSGQGRRVILFTDEEPPAPADRLEVVAWVGKDEFGSGRVGLKRGLTPAGDIPLVTMRDEQHKIDRLVPALQAQADRYNVEIRMVRFVEAETVRVLRPRPQG